MGCTGFDRVAERGFGRGEWESPELKPVREKDLNLWGCPQVMGECYKKEGVLRER